MKRNWSVIKAKIGTVVAFSLLLASVGHASDLSLWDDKHGVQLNASCGEPFSNQSLFKVLSLGLNVKDSASDETQVLARSIKAGHRTSDVQIIGFQKNSKLKSFHNQAKLLAENSKLSDLNEYVIEIQNDKIAKKLGGNFLQIAAMGDKNVATICGTGNSARKYVLFNIFNENSEQPISQVAVREGEALIFKFVKIHTLDEADFALNQLAGSQENPKNADLNPKSSTSLVPSLKMHSGAEKSELTAETDFKTAEKSIRSELSKTDTAELDKSAEPDIQEPAAMKGESSTKELTPAQAVTAGSITDSVICIASGNLVVRDDSLTKVLFRANKLDVVKIFQGFAKPKDDSYIKVQFDTRPPGKNSGWVAKDFVRSKSGCALTKEAVQEKETIKPDLQSGPKVSTLAGDCCSFPLIQRPTTSYKEGMRRFGWRRPRGRVHAACDLYGSKGDSVVSVNDGTIIRDRYAFYGGVYALEVVHTGGVVVRYGEVTGKGVAGVSKGMTISRGKAIAFVGQVGGHGKLSPMLHFELFSGRANGPLTQRTRGGYQRRSDLLDPTDYLSRWEQAKFGSSF